MKTSVHMLFRFLGWNTQGDLGPYTFYTSKRKGLVWYDKAPPTCPPTQLQLLQRSRWTAAAQAWTAASPATREAWNLATTRAHLRIGGLNLWMYHQLSYDTPAIQTIERQTGLTLLP